MKKAAKEIMNECEETLVTTNEVIYAEAYVITEKLNGKSENYNNRRKNKQPLWKMKVERDISEIRGEVAILDELLRRVKLKSGKLNKMKKKYTMKKRKDLPPLKETSLSPLLIFLILTPLSYELNNTGYGYKIGEEKINHLFYMDDLKLYGKNDK